MKLFLSVIFSLGCVFCILLNTTFFYPLSLSLYHLISLCSLIAFVSILLIAIKYTFQKIRSGYIIANIVCFLIWLFVCLFYSVVIASNYFWGSTITLDILEKYLSSFDVTLSVIPVQKWIIQSSLLLYLVLISGAFYFIRIRKSFFSIKNKLIFEKFKQKNVKIAVGLLLVALFISRHSIMELKRTMHFKKEPLIYFVLGPMWGENWSDEYSFNNKILRDSRKNNNCITEIDPSTDKKKPVIVILLDALRSDHLPMYGYYRNTAPFLDSLYKKNKLLLIKNAFTVSTNTAGGIANIFYSKDWGDFSHTDLTLMKYFKLSGYTTSAILTGYHSGWYGLSALYRQDCDIFFESTSNYNTLSDDDLTTLQKIESFKFTEKSFTFIHLLSTHAIGKKNKQFRTYLPDKLSFSTNQTTAFTNNYDNGILQGDFVIKQIFQKLQTDGVLDSATVIITSDHGDLIGEEGRYGHGIDIHEKILEIPILIYDQDMSWYQNTHIATLKDLAPTLIHRVFGKSSNCWQGRSLHNEVSSFSTKIISPVRCELPRGNIHYRNDSILLNIFNKEGNLHKELFKDSTWKRIIR